MARRLGDCRALDLSDSRGLLCGAILAQMGVDVIKVERPGGDETRRIGPFVDDQPHAEHSLNWLAYNANKRGITLSLASQTGRDLFKRLVSTANFVIESSSPGYLEDLGLGYEVLRELNGEIILTSITPFGRSGPFAGYRAEDLTVMAMGGFLYSTGDPDRPPVRINADQAFLHASAYAAAGTLLAHRCRNRHGTGQHVDVSAQEAIAIILGGMLPMWEILGVDFMRSGPCLPGPMAKRSIYKCKDGYIAYGVMGERVRWEGLVAWMESEAEWQVVAADLREKMSKLDFARMTKAELDELEDTYGRFFETKTRAAIWKEARERRFIAYPVNTVRDNLFDEHLKARGFFGSVPLAGSEREVVYPRYLFASNRSRSIPPRPAPRIGEHNLEIYGGEMGLARAELVELAQAGVV